MGRAKPSPADLQRSLLSSGRNDRSGGLGGTDDFRARIGRRRSERAGATNRDDVTRTHSAFSFVQLSSPAWFSVFCMSIPDNIAVVRERIDKAARRAGRPLEEIALMAVSKTQPPEKILQAYAAGLRLFGENRVQEFSAKADALAHLHHADWHMIGHLQTNKATRTAELFRAVDSVDSLKLAEKLDPAARKLDKKLDVLIEINVGGEAAKSGVASDSPELEALLLAAPRLE